MALLVAVAGPYSSLFAPSSGWGQSGAAGSALSPGILSDDGYELSWMTHAQRIDRSDVYGESLLETIYRGADWRIRYRSREYPTSGAANGNVMNAAWPWGKVTGASNSGILAPVHGVAGRRGSDIAGSLVLTAIAGTPAAVSSAPSTITCPYLLATDSILNTMIFTTKIREVPVEAVLFPYAATLNTNAYALWFTTT